MVEFAHKEWLLLDGAFNLHLASERAITAFLLVYTNYKPKTHDLKVLREKIKELEGDFTDRFDLTTDKWEHHFDLLKRAYIEARYSKKYTITREEILIIKERIEWLHQRVEQYCLKMIASIKKDVEA